MNANELTNEVSVLDERANTMRREIEKLEKEIIEVRKLLDEVRTTVIREQQKLADHMAHVEKWDTRRWGTIGFFLAGLITMIVNLILALTRK